MANFKTAPVLKPEEGGSGDGFAGMANLSDGFLGTGYPAATEASFLALAGIALFVAVSTARYFFQGSKLQQEITETISLRQS